MLQYFNPLAWGRWFGQFFVFLGCLGQLERSTEDDSGDPGDDVSGVFAAIVYTGESDWRSRLLDRQFSTAWTAEDYTTAELVIRRKMEGDREDSELLFRLAIARAKQEENEEAKGLMRQLGANEGARRSRPISCLARTMLARNGRI